jgi:hypothetical protein
MVMYLRTKNQLQRETRANKKASDAESNPIKALHAIQNE